MKTNVSHRIESLDWLRGLMALSIMVYHYQGWLFFQPDASTFLGRLGIYAVSIFFVLSGLSLAIVYNRYIKNIKTSIFFFIRRIFRIWPLLWVALYFSIIIYNEGYSLQRIFLNFSTLYGFLNPGTYIVTGAWSIGNEMVYYALTPLIIFLYNSKRSFGNIVFLISVLTSIYFSQFVLNPSVTLANQWQAYINPFNNLFLYIAGIAIYYNFKDARMSKNINVIMLIFCWILFALLPFTGDLISITTGMGRAAFSILSIIIVLLFYKIDYSLPKKMAYQLELFGLTTYSIYLLHPIVNIYTGDFIHNTFKVTNHFIQFPLAVIATIAISLISYRFFEKPFMRLGKYVTKQKAIDVNYDVQRI